MTTLGRPSSGFPGSGGSWLNTSSPAPASRPEIRLSLRSFSTISPPRAVLISSEPGFIFSRKGRLTIPRVPSVRGMCKLTTSACWSSSSSSTRRDLILTVEPRVDQRIVGNDVHSKGVGSDGHGLTDSPEPDESKGLASNRGDKGAVPPAGMNGTVVGDNIPAECQHQGETLLGDAVVVGSRRDRHNNLVARRGLQVDQVVAHASTGDDPQPGSNVEHLWCHSLTAGEHGVSVWEVVFKLLPVEGEIALRVNQLETRISEDLAKWPGLIA